MPPNEPAGKTLAGLLAGLGVLYAPVVRKSSRGRSGAGMAMAGRSGSLRRQSPLYIHQQYHHRIATRAHFVFHATDFADVASVAPFISRETSRYHSGGLPRSTSEFFRKSM